MMFENSIKKYEMSGFWQVGLDILNNARANFTGNLRSLGAVKKDSRVIGLTLKVILSIA